MSLGALNTFFELSTKTLKGYVDFQNKKNGKGKSLYHSTGLRIRSHGLLIRSLDFNNPLSRIAIRSLDFNIYQIEGTSAIRENRLSKSSERIYLLIHGNELLIRENGLHNSI